MFGEAPSRRDIHPRSIPEDRNEGNLNPDPILICWECREDLESAAGREEEEDIMRGETNPEAIMAEEAGYAPGDGPETAVERLHHPSGEPGDDDGAGNPSPREEESAYALEDVDGAEMHSWRSRS